MADASTITRRGAHEALPALPRHTSPSPITELFPQLLDAISRHVAAERAVEGVDYWSHPTLQVAAEVAQTDVATLLAAIQREPLRVAGDRALQDMTHLIDCMIGSEQAGTFQRLHWRLPVMDGHVFPEADGPAVTHTRTMLRAARRQIDAMARLDLYSAAPREDFDVDVLTRMDFL
ncbi:hypothetical protein [Paracoccus benzoatiresistens]|uniref:Uncharacterized protein n=1 Tax=Paracoccus benzoatiresistens TaxID=2997341 RepID=A0ABT4J5V3_9RHOB|nr:hypothetical protein [Paracoccus sp. EF6]MCZ0962461.1 hypothetical protein [Paracoccus sp. EF6]